MVKGKLISDSLVDLHENGSKRLWEQPVYCLGCMVHNCLWAVLQKYKIESVASNYVFKNKLCSTGRIVMGLNPGFLNSGMRFSKFKGACRASQVIFLCLGFSSVTTWRKDMGKRRESLWNKTLLALGQF